MARGIALQINLSVPGMELVAIANRHIDGARRAYVEAGNEDIREVGTVRQLENAIRRGQPAITEDPILLCQAAGIDAIIEVTGAVEYGAKVVLAAIENRKHVIMMNAELDGTVGPVLKVKADQAGVVITNADGDQPGVIMNLYRFVKGIGVKPVLCGNIKGLQDPYRNPTTQEAFARQWKQKAHMVTSFADGTKISFEQAIVANATGMRVARRGMFGPTVPSGTPLKEVVDLYPIEALTEGRDSRLRSGSRAGSGCIRARDSRSSDPAALSESLQAGRGAAVLLLHPLSPVSFRGAQYRRQGGIIRRCSDNTRYGPRVDVVATAKTDLKQGSVLDGMGFYMTYGQAENADVVARENLLPIGLAEGCRLKRDISRDGVLTYDDVELPPERLCDKLRAEQNEYFSLAGRGRAARQA